MSDVVKRAEDAVQQARTDSQALELVAALLAAQQQTQPPACQQHHPAPAHGSGGAGKWLAIGVGGSFLALAVALSFIAVAIGAVSLTVCVLVLCQVWQQWQREQKR